MKFYVLTVVLTAVATLALTWVVWRIGMRYRLYPEIRERDVHTTPKPRIGGVAMYLGWRRFDRVGTFPWIGVSGAMLAGFMLFHKVHSPQYTLWILPFFVLMKVRWSVILTYLLTDLALDLTIFRLFPIRDAGDPLPWWIVTGVVLVLAFVSRFWGLASATDKGTPVFDEKHYVPQGWDMVRSSFNPILGGIESNIPAIERKAGILTRQLWERR